MTKTRLLTTAALALVVSAGVAQAQKNGAPPEPAPSAQQSAPPAKVAPPMNAGEHKGGAPETTGQATKPTAGSADSNKASEGNPRPPQRSGAEMKPGADMKAGADSKPADKTNAAGDMKSKSDAHANDAKPDTKSGMKADTKAGAATSGQGAAGARANLTTEQRTKITSVIKQQKVEKTNVNISINVGTRVPEHVRYYPLPTEVVTIYPEWRGFDYIIVGSTIVVIDPATREIVAVLDA